MQLFALFESLSVTYRILFFLHILLAIVGFGSTFVWPALSSQARKLDDPGQRYAITHAGYVLGKPLSSYPIYGVGLTGILLVVFSKPGFPGAEPSIKFSETWISIAFLLYFIALAVSIFLHMPNIKAMDELGAKLAAGDVTPQPGGPPAEVVEIQERGKKAAMFGGILHLLFVLILLDMVFKPGFAF